MSEYSTLLDMFRASVRSAPNAQVIRYFDGSLTLRELDAASDALAVELIDSGFSGGDRLGIYTQNNPAFVVGLLAAWKAGGAGVPINPMNKERELAYLLKDSGAVALLCLDELYSIARDVISAGGTDVKLVVTASPLDWQRRNDRRLFAEASKITPGGTVDLMDVVTRRGGETPIARACMPDDVAVLTYTSGTTGEPKGAMNTHRTMAFNTQTYRDWIGLSSEDRVLGVAPLFHITGLVAHIGLALLLRCPLILAHRYHPQVVLDAIREHRPTFTIAAITVFIGLSGQPGVTAEDFGSLRAVYSGGAPIAPAVNQRFKEKTGLYIHNVYGLTETNSPTHMVPFGAQAPVDPNTGALSIGVPVFNTMVRVVDDKGKEVAVGELGELLITGPQVVPGYWKKPDATAASIPRGELHTGDIGFMDAHGWFYLVDRKKDLINAGGYKVWPREVEDVLYSHPAVREAAVVGVRDDYRGETVKAYVSLKPGMAATPMELIAHCKANMAAYKYPRAVELIDELPKTATGKILRRELRDRQELSR